MNRWNALLNRLQYKSVTVWLVMVLLLSACGGGATGNSGSGGAEGPQGKGAATDAAATGSEGAAGGHLNVALFWLGTNLDPAEEWNGWTLTRAAIGETLVQFDEKMQMVPKVADTWERQDDKTWLFHIREGVTDGEMSPAGVESVAIRTHSTAAAPAGSGSPRR